MFTLRCSPSVRCVRYRARGPKAPTASRPQSAMRRRGQGAGPRARASSLVRVSHATKKGDVFLEFQTRKYMVTPNTGRDDYCKPNDKEVGIASGAQRCVRYPAVPARSVSHSGAMGPCNRANNRHMRKPQQASTRRAPQSHSAQPDLHGPHLPPPGSHLE